MQGRRSLQLEMLENHVAQIIDGRMLHRERTECEVLLFIMDPFFLFGLLDFLQVCWWHRGFACVALPWAFCDEGMWLLLRPDATQGMA